MFITRQKPILTILQPVTTGIVVTTTGAGCFTRRTCTNFLNAQYYE